MPVFPIPTEGFAMGWAAGLLLFFVVLTTGTARGDDPPTPDPTWGRPVGAAADPGPAPEWIWAGRASGAETVYLRCDFDLAEGMVTAPLHIACDDRFVLYVNGDEVARSGEDPLEWRRMQTIEVGPRLRPGRNAIALECRNLGGPAGLLALLDLRVRTIVSDASWRASRVGVAGWNKAGLDDSHWEPATSAGPLGVAPWGVPEEFDDEVAERALPRLAWCDVPAEDIRETRDSDGDRTILIDFGREVFGRAEILLAEGGGRLLVTAGESLEEALGDPSDRIPRRFLIPVRADGLVRTPLAAFRYVSIHKPGKVRVATATAKLRYYPVTYRGRFECSDPLLTRAWWVGAYTLHLNMQHDIWDGVKRDRLRWMGDLHLEALTDYAVFWELPLLRQTMDRLRADGPPRAHINNIPSYSLWWVLALRDDWRHTGDRARLRESRDALVSLLDWFAGDLDERGLFAQKRDSWLYVDWAQLSPPQLLEATHVLYVRALEAAVEMLRALDDPDVPRFEARAQAARAAATRYLFRAGAAFGSPQANVLAGRDHPAPEWAGALAALGPGDPAKWTPTPWFYYYFVDALAEHGERARALAAARGYWGSMLARGATSFWETWSPDWSREKTHARSTWGYDTSLSHGWSSGITPFLTRWVLGVRPLAPGFAEASLDPFLGDLASAGGAVPTPHGLLEVAWERDGRAIRGRVRVPPGVICVLPDGSRLPAGDHEVRIVAGRRPAPELR
jgi:hypothetical protein